MFRPRLFFRVLVAAALVGMTAVASAATAVAPASAGQPALAVGFASDGKLYAKTCTATPCTIDGGDRIETSGSSAQINDAKLAVVGIGSGRRAIVVTIPSRGEHPSWQAVIVARAGEPHPAVVFSGLTGYVEGPEGERHGGMVVISEPQANGGRRIVVGEQREDVTLCGRPAVLMPELLDASDLKLHPAKVQRLSVEDRAAARDAVAERVAPAPTVPSTDAGSSATVSPAPAPPNLLRAVVATSAIGNPAALTDGNPDTTWAENRGGDGRGEFVLMNAPPQVPLSSIDLIVRPPSGGSPHGVAPRELYIVARSSIVHVTFSEDAWKDPGAHYRVALDPPINTDCLAVVIQSAFRDTPDAQVTLAEVSAGSALETASIDKLISALDGSGTEAQAAVALLARRGDPAFEALDGAFDRLSTDGRRNSLDVLDQAACPRSVPVYLRALVGRDPGIADHARRRLMRCTAESSKALAVALTKTQGVRRGRLAAMLADVDPAAAVTAIVPLLNVESATERRPLRVALARAARTSAGAAVVRTRLADANVPEIAALDLMRSIGRAVDGFVPEAVSAFNRLARPSAGFRTRYLLLDVAAGLATRDETVRRYLQNAMTRDPDAHVRAQAISSTATPDVFGKELLTALADSDVRVRVAALQALSTPKARFATDAVLKRLADDSWPMVRAEAARSLADLGPDPRIDDALGSALDDASPSVVVPALLSLGARHAVAHAQHIQKRLEDDKAEVLVRAAAASALGLMCHTQSVELLTAYAHKLQDPMLDPGLRVIGAAALGALGRLKPADLAHRLAPLRSPKTPRAVRDAADTAFKQPAACASPSTKPRS